MSMKDTKYEGKQLNIKKIQKPQPIAWRKSGVILTFIYAERIERYSLIHDVAFINKLLSEQSIEQLERANTVKSSKKVLNEIF